MNDFGSVAGIDATDVLQGLKSVGTKRFHLFTARSVFEKLGRAFFATVRTNQPADVVGRTLAVPFVTCFKNDVREGVPIMIRLLLKLLHGTSSFDTTSMGTTFGHPGAKIVGVALFVSISFRRRDAWVSIFEVSLDATDVPRLGKRRKTHLADSAGPGTTFCRNIMGRLHNLRGQAHPRDQASFIFGVSIPKVVVFGLTEFESSLQASRNTDLKITLRTDPNLFVLRLGKRGLIQFFELTRKRGHIRPIFAFCIVHGLQTVKFSRVNLAGGSKGTAKDGIALSPRVLPRFLDAWIVVQLGKLVDGIRNSKFWRSLRSTIWRIAIAIMPQGVNRRRADAGILVLIGLPRRLTGALAPISKMHHKQEPTFNPLPIFHLVKPAFPVNAPSE